MLKQLLKKLKDSTIIKVFSLNSIATLIRMLSGMISVKVIAVIIGPAGVALLGQLHNISSIMLGLANGGINTGITKYVAEYKDDNETVKKFLSNALKITLYCSFISALILICGNQWFSINILKSPEYGYVFIIFGFTIIFYTLNALLIAILNGFKEFRKYVIVNICGTLIGLIFSVSLVYLWELPGALINAVTSQSIVFFATLLLLRKEKWLSKDYFNKVWDKSIIKKYISYSAAHLTGMFLFPVIQLVMRSYVISELSLEHAGWWEAMNRLSGTYLGVITSSFAIYYLPRLSEIKDKIELRNEILKCYKFIIPMLLVIVVCIYCFRYLIIDILFSKEFYPMNNLFIWQLIGDFFKIMSWLLSYQMWARAQIKLFIATEIIFNLIYLLFSYILIIQNGLVGLTQAYMINYVLYFIVMIIIYRKLLFVKL